MSYAARAVDGVRQGLGWFNPAQKDFSRRVPVEFTRGHFTVKTVASKRELWQVMTLRYEVFHREYKNRKLPFGLDRDRFDAHADHLAIIDNRIGKIIGTYRLISDACTTDFYSKTEFNISDLERRDGSKVELSRACIHKDYRNGAVITLLWRGIIEYLNQSGARWLFGMASIKSTNPDELAAVYKCLEMEGAVDDSYVIKAREGYRIHDFTHKLRMAQISDRSQAMVPALLRSYLRAGAVVVGDPAIDGEFNCGDFFVVMDTAKMSSAFNRKYQVN
jgi:putative hemolysin